MESISGCRRPFVLPRLAVRARHVLESRGADKRAEQGSVQRAQGNAPTQFSTRTGASATLLDSPRGVPQLVEAQLWVLRAVGSSPISPTTNRGSVPCFVRFFEAHERP